MRYLARKQFCECQSKALLKEYYGEQVDTVAASGAGSYFSPFSGLSGSTDTQGISPSSPLLRIRNPSPSLKNSPHGNLLYRNQGRSEGGNRVTSLWPRTTQ